MCTYLLICTCTHVHIRCVLHWQYKHAERTKEQSPFSTLELRFLSNAPRCSQVRRPLALYGPALHYRHKHTHTHTHRHADTTAVTGSLHLTNARTHARMYARTHARKQAHMHTNTHLRMHACMHARTLKCMHTQTLTHTHTHTHACTHTRSRMQRNIYRYRDVNRYIYVY